MSCDSIWFRVRYVWWLRSFCCCVSSIYLKQQHTNKYTKCSIQMEPPFGPFNQNTFIYLRHKRKWRNWKSSFVIKAGLTRFSFSSRSMLVEEIKIYFRDRSTLSLYISRRIGTSWHFFSMKIYYAKLPSCRTYINKGLVHFK